MTFHQACCSDGDSSAPGPAATCTWCANNQRVSARGLRAPASSPRSPCRTELIPTTPAPLESGHARPCTVPAAVGGGLHRSFTSSSYVHRPRKRTSDVEKPDGRQGLTFDGLVASRDLDLRPRR